MVRHVPKGRKQTPSKCERIQLNRQKAEIFNKVLQMSITGEGRKALARNFFDMNCIVISVPMPH